MKKLKVSTFFMNCGLGFCLVVLPVYAVEDLDKDMERAEVLLKEGKESEALTSFSDVLRRYPTSVSAAKAQYSIGEIYFRMRDYKKAAVEFNKVFLLKNATSDIQAKSALRVGECWVASGEKDKARIEWSAVLRKFVKTPEAEQAAVLMGSLK